jgi:D-alanyl-D-alanine carboxypeptidase (penicillin-binding protein 5/6)
MNWGSRGIVPGCLLSLFVCGFSAYGAPSWISIDTNSGVVIEESNANEVRPPASMIKIMMMLMVVEGLERGDWTLDEPITASRKAQHMGGTQVYLEAGDVHSLGHLMKALAVSSANDAAMAIAENLWGSEEAYSEAMNKRADELGMTNTQFHSVHGLPPDRGEKADQTTARDMATLARVCLNAEQNKERAELMLSWSSMRSYEFRPGEGLKYTTNKLMRRRDDIDGFKTGYIRASGFCITATRADENRRIISVVMGHESSNGRFELAERLLDEGFRKVDTKEIVSRGVNDKTVATIENAEKKSMALSVAEDIRVTLLKDEFDGVTVEYSYAEKLTAPLRKGAKVGEVFVKLNDEVIDSASIIVSENVEEASFMHKVSEFVQSFF